MIRRSRLREAVVCKNHQIICPRPPLNLSCFIMSDPIQPIPVAPLDYQKPPDLPWRPVRFAMGVYLLFAGIAAIAPAITPFTYPTSAFRGAPVSSFVAFVVY